MYYFRSFVMKLPKGTYQTEYVCSADMCYP